MRGVVLILVQSHQVPQLIVVKRVIFLVEAPKVATHVLERREVGLFRQLEFLLEVDDLLTRLDLQQLCPGHFDHDLVAVGAGHREVLLEHFDQVLDFARQ